MTDPMGVCRTVAIAIMSGLALHSSASAAGDPLDARKIDLCLEQRGENLAAGCIGIVMDECLKTADSQERMWLCVKRERAVWDDWLNRDYDTVMGTLAPPARSELRDIERAFVAGMERKCTFVRVATGMTSTIQLPDIENCYLHETAEQWLWLRTFLGGKAN
jgi:uncharacterized protein YecT (DUF1311 family)